MNRKELLKITAALVAAACVSGQPAAFAEEQKPVELSFKVGSDVLMINGESVQVEKPYVAGDGVTLVPVRVISEAFGAEIGWDEGEQKVTVSYSGVELGMWINNPVAEENGRAVTLEYPPELTAAGVTMVPLRFISEALGASVYYDDETGGIHVTTAPGTEAGGMIETHDEPKIGDSYYGWSMDNPHELYLSYRSRNGSYNEFYYGENSLSVSVEDKAEDYNYNRDFFARRAAYADNSMAVVSADRKDGNMFFFARDNNYRMYDDVYITEKYIITVSGTVHIEGDYQKSVSALRALMMSFDCSFTPTGTYDLAELDDGKRKIELEGIGLSAKLPPSWFGLSEENAVNSFSFGSFDKDHNMGSTMSIEVFSQYDGSVRSASWLAAHDLDLNRRVGNPELCTFSEIGQRTYNGFSAYEYTSTVSGSTNDDYKMRDVFFDVGEYVYNVSLYMRSGETEAEIDEILNSITVTEPAEGELGILMRALFELDDNTYTVHQGDVKIELPYSFDNNSFMGYAAFSDRLSNVELSYGGYGYFEDIDGFKESVMKVTRPKEVVKPVAQETIGDHECLTFTSEVDGIYIEYYAIKTDDGYICFDAAYSELYYSEINRTRVRNIIASVEVDR